MKIRIQIQIPGKSLPNMIANKNKFEIAEQVYNSVANDYAVFRPRYPPQLFSLLSTLTPAHDLAWDAGTGNGQAALQIAEHYKQVIATDVCEQQLRQAERRHNVKYVLTPPLMSDRDLDEIVGPEGSVDLLTVAMAVHWFDLERFYRQAKRILKRPGGVVAVWSYTKPAVNPAVDAVFERFFEKIRPFFHPTAAWVFEEYKTLPFPFEAADYIAMEIEERRNLEECLAFFRTWSALVVREGLLSEEFVKEFGAA